MIHQKTSFNGLLHIDFLTSDQAYLDFIEQKLLLFDKIEPVDESIQICIKFNSGYCPQVESSKNQLVVNSSIIDVPVRTIESWIPEKTPKFLDINRMLVQPLGALLQALNFQTLHGGLVCDDRHLIGFLGVGGSGKSTSASVLSLGKYSLLCDDLFFVSSINQNYQFAPLRTHIKISNKSKKKCFIDKKIETTRVMNLSQNRKIVFMFPRYQESKTELEIQPISRKAAFENLVADNLMMETGQKDSRKGRVEIFDFLYNLAQDFPFFEVLYNDQSFIQLESKLTQVLNK